MLDLWSRIHTILHANGWAYYLDLTWSNCFWIQDTIQLITPFASYWDEDERRQSGGGGMEREIDLRMKKMRERLMETQEHDEHITKGTKGTKFYQKQHLVLGYKCPSYRVRDEQFWGNGVSVSCNAPQKFDAWSCN